MSKIEIVKTGEDVLRLANRAELERVLRCYTLSNAYDFYQGIVDREAEFTVRRGVPKPGNPIASLYNLAESQDFRQPLQEPGTVEFVDGVERKTTHDIGKLVNDLVAKAVHDADTVNGARVFGDDLSTPLSNVNISVNRDPPGNYMVLLGPKDRTDVARIKHLLDDEYLPTNALFVTAELSHTDTGHFNIDLNKLFASLPKTTVEKKGMVRYEKEGLPKAIAFDFKGHTIYLNIEVIATYRMISPEGIVMGYQDLGSFDRRDAKNNAITPFILAYLGFEQNAPSIPYAVNWKGYGVVKGAGEYFARLGNKARVAVASTLRHRGYAPRLHQETTAQNRAEYKILKEAQKYIVGLLEAQVEKR